MRKIDRTTNFSSSYLAGATNHLTESDAKAAAILLLTLRLLSALFNHISDCDETFNYWEAISKLVLNNGFQTWEYSPNYAIRSYFYLWFYAFPARFLEPFVSKLMIFYLIRCLLALFCTTCELIFLKGVRRRFGDQVAFITFILLTFSAGMFNSSTAVLPSTFSMYFCLLSFAGYYLNLHRLSLFAIGVSALVGWPFSAIIGLPILIDLMMQTGNSRKFWYLIKWGVIYASLITSLLILVDSFYYCKFVIAPLNIILYNVFTSHGANLYGVEPASFYFINTILNFNLAILFAFVTLPLCLLIGSKKRYQTDTQSLCITSLIFYLWMIIFTAQAHKEERFLFPIYPLICLLAAITLIHLKSFILGKWLTISFCTIFITLSLSRILAIYTGYHAPLDTFGQLPALDVTHPIDQQQIKICLGKEWYRYPSSFFLPNSRWELGFLRSSFKGQLPQPFSDSTCTIQANFNDLNKEETTRYTESIDCDYIVDSDFSNNSSLDPNYSSHTTDWEIVYTTKLLDATKSSKLFRAFYIPIISPYLNNYVNFNLLRNLRKHNNANSKKNNFEKQTIFKARQVTFTT